MYKKPLMVFLVSLAMTTGMSIPVKANDSINVIPSASSVLAEWAKIKDGALMEVYESPEGVKQYWATLGAFVGPNDVRRVWVIVDGPPGQIALERQPDPSKRHYRSLARKYVIDCPKKEISIESTIWFKGNMADGEAVDVNRIPTSPFKPQIKGSYGDVIIGGFCSMQFSGIQRTPLELQK